MREFGAADEVERERVLAGFKLLLPSRLTDDDALADLLRVGHEVFESDGHGRAREVSVCGLVHPIDEVARVLKFDGEEERAGDVDALDFDASGARAATRNLVLPEREAGRVGRAVEKVEIVLSDVVGRRVNRVYRARGEGHDGCRRVNAFVN